MCIRKSLTARWNEELRKAHNGHGLWNMCTIDGKISLKENENTKEYIQLLDQSLYCPNPLPSSHLLNFGTPPSPPPFCDCSKHYINPPFSNP